MIKLEDVYKNYVSGAITTMGLENVSLTVKKGELLSIMGASGSGKSTLINILGGMDTVTSGSYYFNDKEISGLSNTQLSKFRRNNVGFVFQNFALIKRYTVFQNIEIPLCAQSIKKKERIELIQSLCEKLGVVDLLKKYPGELSGGEQQRIAVARAVVGNKNLILADEPTGALDFENGMKIMDIFEQMHQMGKTIIVVTHNQEIADRTERVIHLKDGRILR